MTLIETILDNIKISLRFVLALPRFSKRIIVLLIDVILCVLTVWLAFYLRMGEFVFLSEKSIWAFILSITFFFPIFTVFGLYRIIFRYSGWVSMYTVLLAIAVYGLLYSSIITFYGIDGIPRTIGLIQPLLLFFAIVGFRTMARSFLHGIIQSKPHFASLPKALVYGAGSAGRQLVSALENSYKIRIMGFLDDDAKLQGNVLNNQQIFSPRDLASLIKNKGVTDVLLAIPSASKRRQNEILKKMDFHNVSVRILPSVTDLADHKARTKKTFVSGE